MKSIHTAWALASMATAASAQSTVVLHGAMDTAVRHTRASGSASKTELGNSGLAASRLGFRGNEELGAGLYAGFAMEASLNSDEGTGRPSNANNQTSGAGLRGSLAFNRLSYVKLGSRQWGELRLGRDYAPNHRNTTGFDVFHGIGIGKAGNMVYTTVGTAMQPTTISVSNTVSYWLPPKLGGVHGFIMAGSGENAGGGPRSSDGNFLGLRLGYASGPFNSALAVARTRYESTATTGNYTHLSAGASYEASFAKLYLLHNVVRLRLLQGEVRKTTTAISASLPVSGSGRIRLGYSHLDDGSRGAAGASGGGASQYAVGYVHEFSRRTAVYTTYARLSNSGAARYLVNASAAAPVPGGRSSGLEIGLRHLF